MFCFLSTSWKALRSCADNITWLHFCQVKSVKRLRPMPTRLPTHFANGLQDVDADAKVADMEDGQLQVNVAVVADAGGELLAARLALLVLLARAELVVEDAVGAGLVRRVRQIQVAVDHLQARLPRDLLRREG